MDSLRFFSSNSPHDTAAVDLQGFLQKRHWLRANKWEERWFVLSNGIVSYGKNESAVIKRKFHVHDISEVEILSTSPRNQVFEIRLQSGQVLALQASSPQMCTKWVEILNAQRTNSCIASPRAMRALSVVSNLPEQKRSIFVKISHIKARNLPAPLMARRTSAFVRVNIGPHIFETAICPHTKDPEWPGAEFSCELEMQLAEMKGTPIMLEIFHKKGLPTTFPIGCAELDLQTAAESPIKNDRQLLHKSVTGAGITDAGRVTFDILVQEKRSWEIYIENMFVSPVAKNKEPAMYGTMAPTTHGEVFERSLNADVSKRAFLLKYTLTDGKHKRVYRATKELTVTGYGFSPGPEGLFWEAETLPQALTYGTLDEFLGCSLHFQVLSLPDEAEEDLRNSFGPRDTEVYMRNLNNIDVGLANDHLEDEDERYELFGECYITMDRVAELEESNEKGNYLGRVSANMWNKGMLVGNLAGTLVVAEGVAFRQPQAGVSTELGVRSSAPVVERAYRKVFGNIKKIPKGLESLMQGIEELQLAMSSHQSVATPLSRIVIALQMTQAPPSLVWTYTDDETLAVAKMLLLQLWEYFLEIIEDQSHQMKVQVAEAITLVLHRGELGSLSLLGFDPNQGPDDMPSDKDLEFALRLRRVMIRTLRHVLKQLKKTGAGGDLRVYCTKALVVLTNRLPEFGKFFLDQIFGDGVIAKWHGQDFTQTTVDWEPAVRSEDCKLVERGYPTLDSVFQELKLADYPPPREKRHKSVRSLDWIPLRLALQKKYGIRALREQDRLVKDGVSCKEHLERQHLTWVIAAEYIRYVLHTLVGEMETDRVLWSHVPGYTQIIKAFFLELLHGKRGKYTTSLKYFSFHALANRRLMGPMSKIVLSRTSVHDVATVATVMDLLGGWMAAINRWRPRLKVFAQSLTDAVYADHAPWDIVFGDMAISSTNTIVEDSCLPNNFDFKYFLRALDILLDSQCEQVNLKVLELLYKHWDAFNETHCDALRLRLLNHFPDMFLSWGVQIRFFYQHLLAYRAMRYRGWAALAGGADTIVLEVGGEQRSNKTFRGDPLRYRPRASSAGSTMKKRNSFSAPDPALITKFNAAIKLASTIRDRYIAGIRTPMSPCSESNLLKKHWEISSQRYVYCVEAMESWKTVWRGAQRAYLVAETSEDFVTIPELHYDAMVLDYGEVVEN